MMTTVLLVRHGQTAWNLEDRFRGQVDLPLDDHGLEQAEVVGKRIASDWQPAAIYASSLQRTLQTAAAVSRACGLRTAIHDGLLDIDFGEFSGLTPEAAASQYPDLARAWRRTPHTVHFPDGELLVLVRDIEPGVGGVQRLVFRAGFPFFRFMMRRGMNITPTSSQRSLGYVREAFAGVDERLAVLAAPAGQRDLASEPESES